VSQDLDLVAGSAGGAPVSSMGEIGRLAMEVVHPQVAGIDVHKKVTAPRGALLYSRFSREEFGGYSWI
jgi:hypothetical protein